MFSSHQTPAEVVTEARRIIQTSREYMQTATDAEYIAHLERCIKAAEEAIAEEVSQAQEMQRYAAETMEAASA